MTQRTLNNLLDKLLHADLKYYESNTDKIISTMLIFCNEEFEIAVRASNKQQITIGSDLCQFLSCVDLNKSEVIVLISKINFFYELAKDKK